MYTRDAVETKPASEASESDGDEQDEEERLQFSEKRMCSAADKRGLCEGDGLGRISDAQHNANGVL